jgi:hypothetical protein
LKKSVLQNYSEGEAPRLPSEDACRPDEDRDAHRKEFL